MKIHALTNMFTKIARASAILYLTRTTASITSMSSIKTVEPLSLSYLNAVQSKGIDDRLMVEPGFTIDQLMELAGYSVASATLDFFESRSFANGDRSHRSVAIFCGPGNNGGDGLVAARHLKHFGFSPTVVYPKPGKNVIFTNLLQQMRDLDIPVLNAAPALEEYNRFAISIDALFGFSFQGPAREPFSSIIRTFAQSAVPVISVDVPSGWDVDNGDKFSSGFVPSAIVSLTLPKLCTLNYGGVHYVGGRLTCSYVDYYK
jgi:hydroxyethylthiazole kinase-like uncharacterized protein yjeF